MDYYRLKYLYQKHISNSLNDDEFDEFVRVCEDIDESTFQKLFVEEEAHEDRSFDKETLFNRIDDKIDQIENNIIPIKSKNKVRITYKIAAAIGIVFLFGYLILSRNNQVFDKNEKTALLIAKDSLRLSAANIEFADGKYMELADLPNDTIFYKGISIVKVNDSELSINTSSLSKDFDADHYHMFAAKSGSTLKLILPDKSSVQLNSGSSINISASFGIKNRKVLLKGEGYFDVTHDKTLAFVVDAKGSSISVLGTVFDISAYDQDTEVKATLLEGSIAVNTKTENVLIKPGQQAIIGVNSNITVAKNVDLSQVLAWRDGVFRFKDESIREIMNELSKWYFIKEVKIDEDIRTKFTGSIKRTKQLSDVLQALEMVSDLKFEIEEGRVKVMK